MIDLRDIATLCKEIDCLTAEVDTLCKERDEARRELCRWSSFYYEDHININEGPPCSRDRTEAKRRGWDCFKRRK